MVTFAAGTLNYSENKEQNVCKGIRYQRNILGFVEKMGRFYKFLPQIPYIKGQNTLNLRLE